MNIMILHWMEKKREVLKSSIQRWTTPVTFAIIKNKKNPLGV